MENSKKQTRMSDLKTNLSIKRIVTLIKITCIGFVLFLFPIKLGAPYIDEIGFFIPFPIEVVFGSWPAIYSVALALILLFVLMVSFIYESHPAIKISYLTFFILLFLIWCGCSLFWSVNKNSSMIHTMIIFSAASGFFAAKRIVADKQFTDRVCYFVFIIIGISAVFTAINGIYQFMYGLEEMRVMLDFNSFKQIALLYKNENPQNYALYLRLMSNRIFATFVYPNSYAGYLCIIIPFICAPFCMKKEILRKMYLHIVVFSWLILAFWFYMQSLTSFIPLATAAIIVFPLTIFICLILTGSMGGIITTGILCIFFIMGAMKRFFSKTHFVIVLFLICCIVGSILFFFPLKNKIRSFDARLGYWKATAEMIKDKPLLGSGIGTYGSVYPKYRLADAEETQFAHNTYLQHFAEIGGIGLFLFASVLAIGLLCFFRIMPNEGEHLAKAAGISLVAFCIHSIADFDFSIPCIAFYVFIALGIIDKTPALITLKEPLKSTASKIIILLAVIVVFLASNSMLMRLIKAQTHLNYAQQLIENNINRGETYELLKNAQSLNPFDSKIYYTLAQLYSTDHMWEESFKHYEKAISVNPFRSSYHYAYAKTLKRSGLDGSEAKAILEFHNAREYNPFRKDYQSGISIEGLQ